MKSPESLSLQFSSQLKTNIYVCWTKRTFSNRLSSMFGCVDFVSTHRPNSQQLWNNRLQLITVVFHFCKSPVKHTHKHTGQVSGLTNSTVISSCILWRYVTRFAKITYLSGFFTLNVAFKAFNLESACKEDTGQMLTDRLMFGFLFVQMV